MEIRRQDDVTCIDELIGFPLDQLLIVGTCIDDGSHCFMRCGKQWSRFFIDEGVLFWNTSNPDPEDELYDNIHYISIPEVFEMVNHPMTIKRISMKNEKLTIELSNARSIIFTENGETGNLMVGLG